jgi:Tfp pilus assembly major pilin PilA
LSAYKPEKQLDETDRPNTATDSTTSNISCDIDANTNKNNNKLNTNTNETTEKMNNNSKKTNNNTQSDFKLDDPAAKSKADETDPAEGTDPMDEDIVCIDYTQGFKKPTGNWNDLSEETKK